MLVRTKGMNKRNHTAASVIQKHVRYWCMSRKTVAREHFTAANAIQQSFRLKMNVGRMRRYFLNWTCAIIIQTAMRGFLARAKTGNVRDSVFAGARAWTVLTQRMCGIMETEQRTRKNAAQAADGFVATVKPRAEPDRAGSPDYICLLEQNLRLGRRWSNVSIYERPGEGVLELCARYYTSRQTFSLNITPVEWAHAGFPELPKMSQSRKLTLVQLILDELVAAGGRHNTDGVSACIPHDAFVLSCFSVELVHLILKKATPTKFRAEQIVFDQNETADCMYFLQSGTVDVVIAPSGGPGEPQGTPAVVGCLATNDYFGELSLTEPEGNAVRTATIVSRTDTQALVLDRDQFQDIVAEFPDFPSELMRHRKFVTKLTDMPKSERDQANRSWRRASQDKTDKEEKKPVVAKSHTYKFKQISETLIQWLTATRSYHADLKDFGSNSKRASLKAGTKRQTSKLPSAHGTHDQKRASVKKAGFPKAAVGSLA
jgi:CRP-like cAMP-binding protein